MSPRIEISVDSVGISFYFFFFLFVLPPFAGPKDKKGRRMTMMELQIGAEEA